MRWATISLAVIGALAIGSQSWADEVSVVHSRSTTVLRSFDAGPDDAVHLTHYGYPPYGRSWYRGPVVVLPPVPHYPPVVIPHHGYSHYHHRGYDSYYRGYDSYYRGYRDHDYYRYRSSGHGSVSIYGPRGGFSIGW